MTRTELILRLEQQLGLRIPDRAGLAAETPRDLLAAAVPARSAPVDRRPVVTPESIRENIRVPIDSDTINGVLAWHAHAHAKRTHIEIYARDEHVAVSYGELMSRARNVATSLRQRFRRTARAVTASIDGPAIEFVCCGRALPRHEIRVVDAGGRELQEREEGRIQFRGPSATQGLPREPRGEPWAPRARMAQHGGPRLRR